ncbi:hypothetical protein MTO96_039786 [Rhipicephalus appendiculatus]
MPKSSIAVLLRRQPSDVRFLSLATILCSTPSSLVDSGCSPVGADSCRGQEQTSSNPSALVRISKDVYQHGGSFRDVVDVVHVECCSNPGAQPRLETTRSGSSSPVMRLHLAAHWNCRVHVFDWRW